MKIFYSPHRKFHHDNGSFITRNLLLHHLKVPKLDFTADLPFMKKHTVPIPLQGMSKLPPLGKWSIASSALLLTLGQYPGTAQTVNGATGATPAATQPAAPDIAKELDAMRKRIE